MDFFQHLLQEVFGLGGKDAQIILNTVFLISFFIPPGFIGFFFLKIRPVEQVKRQEWEAEMIQQLEDLVNKIEERTQERIEQQNQFFERLTTLNNNLIEERQKSLESLLKETHRVIVSHTELQAQLTSLIRTKI